MSGSRRRRQLAFMILAVGLVASPSAAQRFTSSEPAAVLHFPSIIVSSSVGQDTIIDLTNTSLTDMIGVRCYLEKAIGGCSLHPQVLCFNDDFCPATETCVVNRTFTDFRIRLTKGQPLSWRVSQGLFALPLNPPCPGCTQTNIGQIPPPPTDPFYGSLRCVAMDPVSDRVSDKNVLTGTATYLINDGGILNSARYNAIGLQAYAGVNDGNDQLRIGGANPEYAACPDLLVANTPFYNAREPFAPQRYFIPSFAFQPCSQDAYNNSFGHLDLDFTVHNEFEQATSFTLSLNGSQPRFFFELPPALDFSTQGTLVGKTMIQPHPGSAGVVMVGIEWLLGYLSNDAYSSFNLHGEDGRTEPDVFGIDPVSTITPTPTASITPSRTITSTPTRSNTPTVTYTPTPGPIGSPGVVEVNLGIAAGRPGGKACFHAELISHGPNVAATSDTFPYGGSLTGAPTCKINPAIGPGTQTDKVLNSAASGVQSWFAQVGGNLKPIPNGPLYSCEYPLLPGASPGFYPIENQATATRVDGQALAVQAGMGGLVITNCNVDCDGSGVVEVGELQRCVNTLLGSPLCGVNPSKLGCSVADANNDGRVSIGEVEMCVTQFLSNCGS